MNGTSRAAGNIERLWSGANEFPPPWWGRGRAGGKVAREATCRNFTLPPTPSHEGRGSRSARLMQGSSGFTLLELLVALAIFAVLAAAIYGSLAMLITTSTRLDEAGKSLRELQTTMRILSRDLTQVINRPVRGGYDEELPALRWPGPDDQLEMTSLGRSNPLHQARSNLQRVAFRVKEGRLERLVWPVLDQAQDSTPFIQPLLTGVSSMEVSFQTGPEQLFPDWPPSRPPPNAPALPKAVRVVLEVKEWGRLERVFLLAGGG